MEKPIVSQLDTSIFCDEKKFYEGYERVSNERKKKIDSLNLSKDKRLSLGAGLLLEEGLKAFGADNIKLTYGEHKKPYIEGRDDLYFSLSHSGEMAVCTIYNKEIGIDVEKVREISPSLIKRIATQKEYEAINSLNDEAKPMAFARLWTAKESYMKYIGRGLGISPKDIEVTFGENIKLFYKGKDAKVCLEETKTDGYSVTICYEKQKG